MKFSTILKFLACVAVPLATGGLSAYISGTGNNPWFEALEKPSFNPPAAVFGPVWTVLYIFMGISLFMIVQCKPSNLRTKAIVIFAVQLFFNFWWSILFFKFHLLVISVIEIFLLWLLIIYIIYLFKKLRPAAAYLQIPYLLWVSFATVLNFEISRINL